MKIQLMLATNNPCNGLPSGQAASLEIPNLISLEGEPVSCDFVSDHLLELDGIRFSIYGHTPWAGNWCWTGCHIDAGNLVLILDRLRGQHWTCTEAESTLFRIYKTGGYIAPRWLERLYGDRVTWTDRLYIHRLDLQEWWYESASRAYLRQERHRRQARRWLEAGDATGLVCRLMFELNRHARRYRYSARRKTIYELKNRLVRHLYEQDYCRSVSFQKQELECWSCHGAGQYDDTSTCCYKCDGTGVYRTYWLYRFVFAIGSRHYIWHQPKPLVDWQLGTVTGDWQSKYTGPVGNSKELDQAALDLYLVTLYEYLVELTGGDLPQLETFKGAIKKDFGRRLELWWWRRKRDLSVLKDRADRVRHFLATGDWPVTVSEDEIPF